MKKAILIQFFLINYMYPQLIKFKPGLTFINLPYNQRMETKFNLLKFQDQNDSTKSICIHTAGISALLFLPGKDYFLIKDNQGVKKIFFDMNKTILNSL